MSLRRASTNWTTKFIISLGAIALLVGIGAGLWVIVHSLARCL